MEISDLQKFCDRNRSLDFGCTLRLVEILGGYGNVPMHQVYVRVGVKDCTIFAVDLQTSVWSSPTK